MRFAILTPTYKRPQLLLRATKSVRGQLPEHVHILINDSPDADYSIVESMVHSDPTVVYLKNEANIGKNASLNRAFEYLRSIQFDGYIVFLDDDDWLAPTCLADFETAISQSAESWLVSRRALADNTSLTVSNTDRDHIHYMKEYLLRRSISGDATHCIHSSVALSCHFPTTIKNAEEWIFFVQVAQRSPRFRFLDSIGTYSEGYDSAGLNTATRRAPLKIIWRELYSAHALNGYVLVYLVGRILRQALRS